MNEIDEIRQEMARIRHDLHEDVAGVVVGANDAMDWRSYPRNHPWATAGVAVLIGYFLVPRRARPTEIVRVINSPAPEPMEGTAMGATAPAAQKRSLLSPWRIMGWGLSFAGPLALNAAQAYASVWIENQLGIKPKGPNDPGPDGPRDRGGRPPMEGRGGFTSPTYGSGRG